MDAINKLLKDFSKAKQQHTQLRSAYQILKMGTYECIQALEKEMNSKAKELAELQDKLEAHNIRIPI